ncbi:NAD(P)-dependent dehydrogenase (short-subunit alcohol dehydrogenase family) [Kribbella rubisoli]|uniref:NAD(P)-dependent dehydrogenase (Short-subunit alcohol dehydrogenase family) n=1 Tax=Kribbella rubisoli TaxID=3075929 RepID=A0A4Q7WW53_9ACTN|nr:SDR family NAD(P)-dependent oxidoreductase [Kribbella rubisoli]RZU14268.1 NAD(P)-dependent dehydrogenase (short-subunit alcohol dehydrogenase family) [Kribbella rubisoli]
MNRTAIVTGAASPRGIGRATALLLASQGWNIGILDIASGDSLASEITSQYNVKAHAVTADVSDESQVLGAIDELEAALPPLAALANLAGVSSPMPYLDLTSEEWHRVININLNGVHYVTHRVAKSMVRHNYGRIVSVSSTSAQLGGGTYSKTPYSVAKAAVIGLTRALARELGPHNITVNAVAPGPIDTDIMGGPLTPDRRSTLVDSLLVNHLGQPADVASAIAFLMSENSAYITGHTLNVDGGLYMH